MTAQQHTFLFEEAVWKAAGKYFDDANNEFSMEGMAKISHKDNQWLNEGYMKVLSTEPQDFFNYYEIEPFNPTNGFTAWTSYNPTLGLLKGKYMIVDDTIISTFESEYSNHSGVEYLLQNDVNTYLNRGFTFMGNKKLASWSIILKRLEN